MRAMAQEMQESGEVLQTTRGEVRTLPAGMRPKPTVWKNIRDFTKSKPLGAAGGAIAILLILIAIFAPFIATHDPELTSHKTVLASPSSEMFLGGDQIGRDVFSRLVYGARVSLLVGILSVLFGVSTGFGLGLISAYFGGKADLAIQRVMDAIMSFPALILALAIMAALGASIVNVVIALSAVFVPGAARTIRFSGPQHQGDRLRAGGAGGWCWRPAQHDAPHGPEPDGHLHRARHHLPGLGDCGGGLAQLLGCRGASQRSNPGRDVERRKQACGGRLVGCNILRSGYHLGGVRMEPAGGTRCAMFSTPSSAAPTERPRTKAVYRPKSFPVREGLRLLPPVSV